MCRTAGLTLKCGAYGADDSTFLVTAYLVCPGNEKVVAVVTSYLIAVIVMTLCVLVGHPQ